MPRLAVLMVAAAAWGGSAGVAASAVVRPKMSGLRSLVAVEGEASALAGRLPDSPSGGAWRAFSELLWESPLSCTSRWLSGYAAGGDGRPKEGTVLFERGHVQQFGALPGTTTIATRAAGSTMFGGVPWLLLIPVVIGAVAVLVIQVTSLYSEWKEPELRISGIVARNKF
mmetsp:Transcript_3106/g.9458  ORF Transcript_3106/g.9458 Transcript_3106/m.9458 type:complete len:170 (-) Transcript_3106:114-623(-)